MKNELSLKDRCDRCNAAAMVRVMIGELPLEFCGHHYRANKDALEKANAVVTIDNTEAEKKELATV